MSIATIDWEWRQLGRGGCQDEDVGTLAAIGEAQW